MNCVPISRVLATRSPYAFPQYILILRSTLLRPTPPSPVLWIVSSVLPSSASFILSTSSGCIPHPLSATVMTKQSPFTSAVTERIPPLLTSFRPWRIAFSARGCSTNRGQSWIDSCRASHRTFSTKENRPGKRSCWMRI